MEIVTSGAGDRTIKRYLPGGILISVNADASGMQTDRKEQYMHHDHLGSLDVITNAFSAIATDNSGRELVFSFDAWGQRRNALHWTQLLEQEQRNFSIAVVTSPTPRGFTMHEHLDEVGLIHMNGRIYDPRLGRFLQADPFIQEATNTHSYNRYSYVINNPLNGTDPSGFLSDSQIFSVFQVVVTVALTFTCQACIPAVTAYFAAMQVLVAGGNLGDIAIAAATAYATASISMSLGAEGYHPGEIFAVSVIGGISSLLNGGKFGHGFASAGVGTVAGQKLAPVAGQTSENVAKGIASMVVAGTVSEATGGKFANGAATAAFAAAIQAGMSRGSSSPEPAPEIIDGGGDVPALTADLAKLPPEVLKELKDAGVKIVAVKDSVTEYRTDLKGVRPRGWSPGKTWDIVPGLYDPKTNTVIVATSGKYGHGSFNLTLHEVGHAYNKIMGNPANSAAFKSAYRIEYSGLAKYYQQPGGAGLSETFAESFARHYGGDSSFQMSQPALSRYWSNGGP